MNKSDYIMEVIEKGDEGSALLRALTARTLDHDSVDVIGSGIPVLRLPTDHDVLVHSHGLSEPMRNTLKGRALVHELVKQALRLHAQPIAMANVIDSSSGDLDLLRVIANGLVGGAEHYGVAIVNGENAILGKRIIGDASVSGTMVSIVPKGVFSPGRHRMGNVQFAVFDHDGKPVYMNSDGVGTKTEFYERSGRYPDALLDSLAMKLDDAVKIGAVARVVSDVIEMNGDIPTRPLFARARRLSDRFDITYILQPVDGRYSLRGYSSTAPVFNVSGTVVSTLDEERLSHPLILKEGDTLVAIVGQSNPRSNGISKRRETMVDLFGTMWHETEEGKLFLPYLSSPSEVLYPVFSDLVSHGLATGVFHMSGGAFKGKLGAPIANQGLQVRIEGLPDPPWQDKAFVGFNGLSMEDAYSMWPMGVDGFVSTHIPSAVVERIASQNAGRLHGIPVGTFTKGNDPGVFLDAYNGERLYFTRDS